jgi:hypothetical protein
MIEILNKDIIVNKTDMKTHKKVKFEINEEAESLKIDFDFSPKVVLKDEDIINAFKNSSFTEEERIVLIEKYLKGEEELKNLATLSLYYEDTFIGCAHRQPSDIVIGQEESSRGFINMPIKKGQWEMIISIHGVFTDEMRISLKASI